jgi:hypothetical protein
MIRTMVRTMIRTMIRTVIRPGANRPQVPFQSDGAGNTMLR